MATPKRIKHVNFCHRPYKGLDGNPRAFSNDFGCYLGEVPRLQPINVYEPPRQKTEWKTRIKFLAPNQRQTDKPIKPLSLRVCGVNLLVHEALVEPWRAYCSIRTVFWKIRCGW
ncbi:hypothetical protein CEXT_415381 [Caerostris extrusa]|uniref:Uncharacterized protein n=1 Tax=Caerostris extrusa TaxID=172846 RepID=A0AAV4U3U4_CAEEX|nr:hypothetical protein CEXT_415381 [Caerostris extrusa]